MKLRLNANSLRLRLGMSEVDALVREGRVAERVDFGPDGAALVYEVRTADDPKFSAAFGEGGISIFAPRSAVVEWATGDELSLRGSQAARGGAELAILIEKDLACRTRENDRDNADAFPHPPNRPDC
ncbi:MAG: hypothetical protein IPM25_14345 [Chloracidobacterium sp.]|nr:hypothetical protein [Chloracidobacterium sp.]